LVAIVGLPAVIHGIEKCKYLGAKALLLEYVLLEGRDAFGPLSASTAKKFELNGFDLDVFCDSQLKFAS
jgi:hypothetical protein